MSHVLSTNEVKNTPAAAVVRLGLARSKSSSGAPVHTADNYWSKSPVNTVGETQTVLMSRSSDVSKTFVSSNDTDDSPSSSCPVVYTLDMRVVVLFTTQIYIR